MLQQAMMREHTHPAKLGGNSTMSCSATTGTAVPFVAVSVNALNALLCSNRKQLVMSHSPVDR